MLKVDESAFVGTRSELLTCKNVSKPAMFIIYLEEGWGLLRYFQDPFLEGQGKLIRNLKREEGGHPKRLLKLIFV